MKIYLVEDCSNYTPVARLTVSLEEGDKILQEWDVIVVQGDELELGDVIDQGGNLS
jgi:hypothetical protein